MRPSIIHRSWILIGAAMLACVAGAAKCYGQTPTAEETFQRYVSASGGAAALRAVRTRISVGQVVAPGGTAPLRLVQAVPDRFLRAIDSPVSGHSENGYDGRVAWSRNSAGVREISGPQTGMVIREQRIDRPLSLASLYSSTTTRSDTLDARAVRVVDAVATDGTHETLFFDVASGLLSAWDVTIGDVTIRSRLEDYRTVDGVLVPFRIRRSRPGFAWSEEFTSVVQNAAVDSAGFSRPRAP